MADFVIASLRGGLNNSDAPASLPDDQCQTATNVEWVDGMLADRRRGATAIDVATSGLVGRDRVTFLHRHLPTSDETAAELWALGVTGTTASALCRKTTAWTTVAPVDAITLTGGYQYLLDGQTLHGKLFLTFKSGQSRLHVWDGTTLRRAGLAAPTAAPTSAETGSAGTYAGTRYFRVREAVLSGSTVLRRSEPSPALTVAPSGTKTGTVVTKPADMGESATHWELEASTDNATFYRIARTVVATTTATDTVAYSTGYASGGTLSEDSGDYTPMRSARFLLADEDRLIGLGDFDDDTYASRMTWTPVYNDPGVGNDERVPLDPVSYRDLDTFEGGGITGGVGPVNGEIWIFKRSHTYKAIRTGVRSSAYDVFCITKKRGALPGSMVEGVDQSGSPCVYFLDPRVGPCRVGSNGRVVSCGRDIRATWKTVNVNAANVVSRVVFYEDVGQVHWFVATNSSDNPDTRLVLHVNETRDAADGVRRGWAIWDGPSAAALATCMFATNVDAGVARGLTLVPFVGLSTSATPWRTDTGTTDNGTAYTATVQSKPFTPATILNKFRVKAGAILAKAVANAVVTVTATRDCGKETKTVTDQSLAATASETQVVRSLDALAFAELTTVDVAITDGTTNAARWEVSQVALAESRAQTA